MLSPIIRLLNNMKYSRKFRIIGFVLILPLVIASVLLGLILQEEKKTVEQRLEGAEYNILLKDIFQNIQQSSGLNIALLTGDAAVEEKLEETVNKVNQAFDKIEAMEVEMKNDFHTKEQLEAIQKEWVTLEQTTWETPLQILTQYESVLQNILDLMAIVANDSELLLAQSKEMYNLIYNASIELPKLTDQLGQMRSLSVSILNRTSANTELNNQLNSIYIPTLTSIDNLKNSVDLIFTNEEFATALQPYVETVEKTTNTYKNMMESLATGPVSSTAFYDVATESINAYFDLYTASLDIVKSTLQDQYDSAKQTRLIIYGISTLIIVLATVLFMSLYLSIRNTIKLLEDGATKVANGDLNVQLQLNTNDEMKKVETAFNSMTTQLKELVQEITISAEYVASSSEQLNASSQEATASVENVTNSVSDMMSKTNLQEISLRESAQAMEEMVIGIERIAANSVRISALTNETTDFANTGNETVEKALQQMNKIKDTVQESSEKINELNKQSAEIDSIVNVITAIADQTNLLALNAAIEAARAGEQGKGFAVVADEVRKLAEESRCSAAKIAELIGTIQKETINSVQNMHLVTDNVEIGIKVTEESAYEFNHILTRMQELNPQMEDISATATEFSSQAEQVASAMEMLLEMAKQTNETTQGITASSQEQLTIMEEVSSATNTLAEMADSLQNLVLKFKL